MMAFEENIIVCSFREDMLRTRPRLESKSSKAAERLEGSLASYLHGRRILMEKG